MAVLLTLGVSAKVTDAMKAIQKPVTIQNAPTPVCVKDMPLKTAVAMPQIALDSKAKAGALVSLADDGSAETSAYYSRSLGGFFTGISYPDQISYSGWNYFTFYPAFTDVTHTAYIPEGVTPSWTYYVNLDDTIGVDGGNEMTLTQALETGYTYAPELEAGDSLFAWGYLKAGGGAYYARSGIVIGETEYDTQYFLATNSDRSWTGNGSYVNPTQTCVNSTDVGTIYSDVDEGVSILEGVAEFISVDPNRPFVLNGVYPVVSCPETGGTVTLTIYKALQTEAGVYAGWTDEVVVTADVDIEPKQYGQMLEFSDLLTADPESGLDVPIVVDYPILVVLSSTDGAQFYPTWLNHAENIPTERHAFLYWQEMDPDTGEYEPVVTNANWGYNFAENDDDDPVIRYATAWQWQYDLDYNYLYSEEDTFEAPVEGGSKEFAIQANWSSKAWTIETADGDELPEWLTYEVEDITEEEDGETYYSGESVLTLTAAALDGDAREVDVVLYFDGAKQTIHVTQGGETPDPYDAADVNADGNVNAGDVSAVYNVMLGVEIDENIIKRADVNADGSVNAGDVSAVYAKMLGN